jgi:hypothetical protein
MATYSEPRQITTALETLRYWLKSVMVGALYERCDFHKYWLEYGQLIMRVVVNARRRLTRTLSDVWQSHLVPPISDGSIVHDYPKMSKSGKLLW